MMFRRWMILAALLGTTACSTAPTEMGPAGPRFSESAYEALLSKHLRHAVKYDGFYNKFEFYALFMNSDVQTAILQKRSDTFAWDTAQSQRERERLFQENSTQTKFFLSFFSPVTRLNDLHKGTSIWRAYLEVGGKRYEGKITKSKGKLEDLQAIYPFHTRWGLPFEVTFSVPLSGAETSGQSKFILTSTQGSAELIF